MDDHNDLREMIAEGRSKLEWERKIPDDKLVDLKDMLDSKDFKTNLPKVINNIICQYYLFTHHCSQKKKWFMLDDEKFYIDFTNFL